MDNAQPIHTAETRVMPHTRASPVESLAVNSFALLDRLRSPFVRRLLAQEIDQKT